MSKGFVAGAAWRRRVMPVLLGALVLAFAGAATGARADTFTPDSSAVLPAAQFPNDPDLLRCESQDPNTNCGGDEDWGLYGRLTGDTCRAPGSAVADRPHPDGGLPCWAVNAKDPQHAAGINATGAWAQGNWGRDDILVGYIEGGVNYRADGVKDALDNIYLNTGELPYPQGADGKDAGTYDLDHNGRVDIRDYANDPRVNPACPDGTAPFSKHEEGTTRSCVAGGQHDYLNKVTIGGVKTAYLSPEDLIAVFGHCRITAHRLASCPPGARIDNDGNGYPNDVSGWNAYRNTNDPQTEDPAYGHASGLLSEVVGEKDNGYGSAGICATCRIVPIKQGAECLGRSDAWAEAILYAANLGVTAISSVVVSYQYSSYGRAAIEYANRKGILLSLDSNDFDSTDHTDGMLYPHAIPGNSVVTDDNRQRTSTTHWFRARSNVTSYGPHNVFSGMQTTTSGATPFMAGLLAMVQSAARNARDAHTIPRELRPNEVRQVLMNTASAVIPQTQAPDVARQWPGNPGSATDATHTNWSTQYGYGRIDLGAATALVKSGLVPPTTEFSAPDWYAYVDPARQRSLTIRGYVQPSAWRSKGVRWTLEWATGADPSDKDFHTISTGRGARTGTLGTLDLRKVPKAYAAGPQGDTNTPNGPQRYTLTLRIRALDGNGLKGEDRRAITVRTDPTLVGGRPRHVGGEPAGGTSYVDLEGRRQLDLVVGTADGDVHVTRPDGSRVPGFPVHTKTLRAMDPTSEENYPAASYRASRALRDARDPVSGTAVGDLFGDGRLEVVATTSNAYVYAWDQHGRLLKGFPVHSDAQYASLPVPTPIAATPHSRLPARGNWSPPVLADLEGNGRLDILMTAYDGHVYAWRPGGAPVPGWPVEISPPAATLAGIGADPAKLIRDPKLMYSVAVGDVLGNGHPQVFVGGFDCADDKKTAFLYGIQPDGNAHPGGAYLPGWPVALRSLLGCYDQSIDFVQEGTTPPSIVPVGGKLRVLAAVTGGTPQVIAPDGTIERGMSLACASPACAPNPPYFPGDSLTAVVTGQGGAGDLTGDGTPDLVQSVVGATSTSAAISGSTAGQATLGQSYEKAWDPLTGDVLNGFPQRQDGFSFFDAPLVAGLASGGQRAAVEANDSSWIHAFQPSGAEAPGFPKFTGQWPSFAGVVGDPGMDGHLRVAFGTREGDVYQWRAQGSVAANDQWWHFHHDERNTSLYGLDTRRPAAVGGVRVRRGRLTFAATGDDGVTGTAASYTVRVSARRITAANLARTRAVPVRGRRAAVGRARYAAIQATDDAGNRSAPTIVRLR